MNKSLTSIPLVAALAAWTNPAAADPIPSGTIALGAERLSGFFHSADSVGNLDTTRNKISLLGQRSDGPYDLPRIGIDGFIIDGLSLGGTIAITHTSITRKVDIGVGSGSVDGSETAFLFAPRVGYALMFSEHVGIWPRGGFSYYLQNTSVDGNGGESTSLHYISINVDAPFLFKLAPNFAITAGPAIDVSFEGSQKTEPNNGGAFVKADASSAAFGIAAGLVALL